jgi:hypothetical protein
MAEHSLRHRCFVASELFGELFGGEHQGAKVEEVMQPPTAERLGSGFWFVLTHFRSPPTLPCGKVQGVFGLGGVVPPNYGGLDPASF